MPDKPEFEPLDYPQWETEIAELNQRSASTDIHVLVLWPLGRLYATGFQPLIDKKTIQIPLQRQAGSGLADAYISLSLPTPAQEEAYEKYTTATGDVLLTMQNELRGASGFAHTWTHLFLSTSPELLRLVDEEQPSPKTN